MPKLERIDGDPRWVPCPETHRGCIVQIAERCHSRGNMQAWTLDETIDHAIAVAFMVMQRWYDPDKGTVTTFLRRVLPQQLFDSYQIERGLGRHNTGCRKRKVPLRLDLLREDGDSSRSSWGADYRTPLDCVVEQEERQAIVDDAQFVFECAADYSRSDQVFAWMRCNRSDTRGGLSLGKTRGAMNNASREFKRELRQ